VNESSTTNQPSDLLVIGYGNELRCDDGVGAKVAAAVAEWNLSGVHALVCHQLTPELAEPISAARCVVFVDASADAEKTVELRKIEPADSAQIMAHAADPRVLLALGEKLFGGYPKAFLLAIPAENFAFGEELSPRARAGLQIALQKIRALAEAR
jgi:hydrogenase maturation protease